MPVRAVLLDIEGTTTPIAFVHDVLFPYARARLAQHVAECGADPEVQRAVGRLVEEHADDVARGERPPAWRVDRRDPAWVVEAVAYAGWLMDRDRKSPGLKTLQGLIWERGYQAGELRGQVFADVPVAMKRWHAAGVRMAIYSSGSELAQRRLFGSTEYGDLVPVIEAFFDTAVGPKVQPASYGRIASALHLAPADVLFVSDVTRELDAASSAGVDVVLAVRPGNPPQPPHEYRIATTFDGLVPASAARA